MLATIVIQNWCMTFTTDVRDARKKRNQLTSPAHAPLRARQP